MKTVVLLTAGTGSRMGKYASVINKTLLPIHDKAIISHIIEQFDSSTHFVVALGFGGDDVERYLRIAHPENNFTYVHVDEYDGPNTGPARSLQCCKPHLSGPFFVIACDAHYEGLNDFPTDRNYIGVSSISQEDSPSYCNVILEENRIVEVLDKKFCDSGVAVNGVFFFKDVDIFWDNLDTIELSTGWSALETYAHHLVWTDLGTFERYQKFYLQNSPYDFSKTDEFLWIVNGRVIKWFKDRNITEKRARRAAGRSCFPNINIVDDRFYSYELIPGSVLYECATPELFDQLLDFMRDIWSWDMRGFLSAEACTDFYRTKTLGRLKAFREKYPDFKPKVINGKPVKVDIYNALDLIDWNGICRENLDERAAFIHGDLQFDNILWDGDHFTLLDWRQDFAGSETVGDYFYDVAKLLGGLIIDYRQIKKNKFHYQEEDDIVSFSLPPTNNEELVLKLKNQFPSPLIDQIVSLIYLNMAPLHSPPFDKLLFCLSLERLNDLR